MRVLGVTGGIGSGKTTVVKAFEKLGVPVFIADQYAKDIMDDQEDVKTKIKTLLGSQSYKESQGVERADRAYIAAQVFKNKELLTGLNKIIHPAVAISFEKWKSQSTYNYGIYEAAILFETGGDSRCDKVLLVAAPEAVRVDRVMRRDGVSSDQVRARMANQWSQRDKLMKSELVIHNIDMDKTVSYVRIIHEFMLKN